MGKLTYQSEVGQLKSVLLKSATSAFINQQTINQQWKALNYLGEPSYQAALREYTAFEQIFHQHQIKVHHLADNSSLTLDALYCRDASIMTNHGAIICNMGKGKRKDEPEALKIWYESNHIPILGTIEAPGILEGGDVTWIDSETLAVGHGYRTNAKGIQQLKRLAKGKFEVLEVQLPHFKGPEDVFHLMSILSPIDNDLFLVYSPLMTVPFRNELVSRNITLVEVPEDEFESQGGNVLAIAPRVCIMLAGNPQTKALLEAHGITVYTYLGEEISMKGCGGPTCLTRPLGRIVSTGEFIRQYKL